MRSVVGWLSLASSVRADDFGASTSISDFANDLGGLIDTVLDSPQLNLDEQYFDPIAGVNITIPEEDQISDNDIAKLNMVDDGALVSDDASVVLNTTATGNIVAELGIMPDLNDKENPANRDVMNATADLLRFQEVMNKGKSTGAAEAPRIAREPTHSQGSPYMKDLNTLPYDYIGCYKDNKKKRDFKYLTKGISMTVEQCAREAHTFQHRFFALQWGGECHHGNSFGTYGLSDACNDECEKDPGETCGGYLANSVYMTEAQGAAGRNGEDSKKVGLRGVRGPKGFRGLPGARGATGPPAKDGKTGARGDQGDKGDKGPKGRQGPVGEQGDRGDKGDTGNAGTDSRTANDGVTGPQGPKGDTGPRGKMGPKGLQGDQGPKGKVGPKGPVGDRGEQGLRGDKGPDPHPGTGATGPKGPIGLQGIQGEVGPTGPIGPRGIEGLKGDTGPRGLPGDDAPRQPIPIGPHGLPGPPGPAGPPGDPFTVEGLKEDLETLFDTVTKMEEQLLEHEKEYVNLKSSLDKEVAAKKNWEAKVEQYQKILVAAKHIIHNAEDMPPPPA